MPPARIVLHVGEVLGPAREHEDGAGDAVVAGHGRGAHDPACELGSGPVAAALAQRLGALIDPDVGHLCLQEQGGRLGDAAERRGAVGRRRHEPREAAEGGQTLGALVRLTQSVVVGVGGRPRPLREPGRCRLFNGEVQSRVGLSERLLDPVRRLGAGG